MRNAVLFALFSGCFLSLAYPSHSARADPADPDVAQAAKPEPIRTVALELNPLALITGRYSFNLEVLLGPHAAFIANPFARYSSGDTDSVPIADFTASPRVTAGGSELGVRYYSRSGAMKGFFAGGSVIVGGIRTSTNTFEVLPLGGTSFTSSAGIAGQHSLLFGFALDAGGQYVSKSGFIVSGGGGFSFSNEIPRLNLFGRSQSSDFVGLPRLLFSVGQAL